MNSDPISLAPSCKQNVEGIQSWVVWGTAALFYLYEFILRASPSVMTDQLMDYFKITSTELGFLTSFYYFAYVPLQIPCGMIVDKLGARFIITASSFLCTIGTVLFSVSESLLIAQVGRFLIGMGSACAFISCLKLTVDWFSPARFALVAGLTNMMGTLGGTFACTPLALLVNYLGWQKANLFMAMIGVFITILCWAVVRSKNTLISKSEGIEEKNILNNFKKVTRNKQIWLAGIVGGLMYIPLSAFSELWAVPFLMATYHTTNSLAAGVNIALFIGAAAGSLVTATLSKRWNSYLYTMRFCALMTCFTFIIISYAQYLPFYTMYILFFAAGFFTGGQVLCFTFAKDHSKDEFSGTSMAFTNAVVMMSGILFQPLLGKVLDMFWEGTLTDHGIRVYTQESYQYSILALPISLLISWYLLRFCKETKYIA